MQNPIDYINEATNLSKHTQQAFGFSLPPFIPLKTAVTVKGAKDVEGSAEMKSRLKSGLVENTNWIIPLTFKSDGLSDFKFPLDPVISLSSKNIITRRYVNKSLNRGSIKERWGQDDWEISITGLIIEENQVQREDILRQLRWYLDESKAIDVVCPLFNEMGILRIAIESYDFPFTSGEANQAFVIKAYSDESYTLLVEN